MDQLKGIFATQKVHIAGIVEFKPKYGTIPPEELLQIDGYDSFINTSHQDPDTRGVIVYIKQHLKAQRVDNELCSKFKDSVWLKIPTHNKSDLLVGCIYRSGTREKALKNDKNLHEMIKHMALNSGFKSVLIMGDFNHPGF